MVHPIMHVIAGVVRTAKFVMSNTLTCGRRASKGSTEARDAHRKSKAGSFHARHTVARW